MTKKHIIILFLILFFSVLFAGNFVFEKVHVSVDMLSSIISMEIKSDKVIYKTESSVEDSNKEKINALKKVYRNGLLFFVLSEKLPDINIQENQRIASTNDMLVLAGKIKKERLNSSGIFSDGEILLFAETASFESLPWNFITPPRDNFDVLIRRDFIDCSSFLKEKNKEYKIENLCKSKPGTPWVEGVPGDGIGEGFTICNSDIDPERPYENVFPYLLIMNGYISYSKPYLYKQNNRVKKIKVTGIKSGKSKVLNVLDTPHPQTVDISFITEPEDIRVEIADVYKGTKYDDTCINFCITFSDKVIPYEDKIK